MIVRIGGPGGYVQATLQRVTANGGQPRDLDPEAAWAAVLERDARWDGRMVYGVTSTRIYCRPSCPSRRPRRDRTRFFGTPAEAEAAGFRACRRCRPGSEAATSAEQAVARARRYLDDHASERVSLARLAREAKMSPWHLQRTFRRLVGLSPREYAASRRTETFRDRLRKDPSVSRATYEAGFGSSSRVYEKIPTLLGMTPGAFRKGGAGMAIRYAVVACPYGRLLVAVTDRGVAAVTLGDGDRELERGLRAQFPRADITRVDDGADAWLGQLVRRVSSRVARPGVALDGELPLDLQGTAFQWKVWRALLAIPAGETRTYQELARAVGRPAAIRAVANACAANRAAVVVPCHRVIRSDGSLGGYRWGLPRKTRLLERERSLAG
ncbi:MAG TPA: bifunctional DNA-binding transcriptional regulator/O6-methylguanine-DNA methyltransferase Ada [Gemmatimonadales bacterium]|nr:bifunctional DNA-binding transcriptional regulator/O6-methylguanine-DNA methyltransferase Ada [Gemmatimonadales bacterium]